MTAQIHNYFKDPLDFASVVTNTSESIVAGDETRYYPFGEAHSDTDLMLTDKLFTGQCLMADLGIHHYGARLREAPRCETGTACDTCVAKTIAELVWFSPHM